MEDRLLVRRCKRGSAEAIAQIYRKYRKDLLILAVALLNDKAVAEDVVQDVFVRLAQLSADRPTPSVSDDLRGQSGPQSQQGPASKRRAAQRVVPGQHL